MTDKTGQCLCGAVKFAVQNVTTDFGACHCEMCRRWTGSALLAFTASQDDVDFTGLENISKIQSSDRAERAWCNKCGSGIWYRLTVDTEFRGTYHLPVGLLNDPSGMELKRQIFIDKKPTGYSYSNKTTDMTEAEVWAKYAPNRAEN